MRLVFDFLWGGRYESVTTSRILAGVEVGRRDVLHDCIFISFLCRELSTPVVHPSGYFLRLYFAYEARRLMVWSNIAPWVEQQPWHYHHAARWLKAQPEATEPAVTINHRALYKVVSQRVVVSPVVGIPTSIWRGIQPKGLENRLKDLNWLCLHKCLPVRETLYRHGLTKSPVCSRNGCLGEETVRHVMWDCPFAEGQSHGGKVGQWLGQMAQGHNLTWDKVERGVGVGNVVTPMWTIVSLTKRFLWLARQELTKSNRESSVEGVVRRVQMEVKGRRERDIRKWGKHAALERWKGVCGWAEVGR